MKRAIALACLVSLAACGQVEPSPQTERSAVQQNQKALVTATPLPKLSTSLERENIIERLDRINQQNMTGCVYLVSYGQVMAFYPVRGKVSSLNSYLTPGDTYLDDPNGSYDSGSIVIEAPDLDGAYGDNAQGIFFFTADSNTYVEWAGEYLFTDSCLALNQQPKLVRSVK